MVPAFDNLKIRIERRGEDCSGHLTDASAVCLDDLAVQDCVGGLKAGLGGLYAYGVVEGEFFTGKQDDIVTFPGRQAYICTAVGRSADRSGYGAKSVFKQMRL